MATTEPKASELDALQEDELAPVMSLDISHIQTEDDTPVDNLFSERQQRLLVETLYASAWKPAAAEKFAAMSNVGLFYGIKLPPLVPNMLLSLDVSLPQGAEVHKKRTSIVFYLGIRKTS